MFDSKQLITEMVNGETFFKNILPLRLVIAVRFSFGCVEGNRFEKPVVCETCCRKL